MLPIKKQQLGSLLLAALVFGWSVAPGVISAAEVSQSSPDQTAQESSPDTADNSEPEDSQDGEQQDDEKDQEEGQETESGDEADGEKEPTQSTTENEDKNNTSHQSDQTEGESNNESESQPAETASQSAETQQSSDQAGEEPGESSSDSTPSAELADSTSTIDATESADLETGSATASATTLSLVNTTQQNSEVSAETANLGEQSSSVNLAALIDEPEASDSASLSGKSQLNQVEANQVEVENQAEVVLNTFAEANTGDNSQSNSGDVSLVTGSATAISNSIALINSTLINSTLQYYLINILNNYQGDLILPNLEYLQELLRSGCISCEDSNLDITNQANVIQQANAFAETGQNQQLSSSGDADLTIGDANALAVSESDVNSTYISALLFNLSINNLGNWQGFIFGWTDPSSVHQTLGSAQLSAQQLGDQSSPANEQSSSSGADTLTINNQANVVVNTSATANTGNNQQNVGTGAAGMETGSALALANSQTFVNNTYINSYLWDGSINILGDWAGNIYFAYPDLDISYLVTPNDFEKNEQVRYVVRVANVGLATARDAEVKISLPSEIKYLGSSWSDIRQDGSNLYLRIDELDPGEFVDIEIIGQALNTVSSGQKLMSQASVTGRYTELMGNNQASAISQVQIQKNSVTASNNTESDDRSDLSEQPDPIYTVSASSNINQFIYAGDTGIFQINIKNEGGHSYDTYLYVALVDPDGYQIGGGQVGIGELSADESANISFNMMIPNNAVSGLYRVVAWVEGENYLGSIIVSADAETSFQVNGTSAVFGELVDVGDTASYTEADIPSQPGSVKGVSTNADGIVSKLISLKEMLWLGLIVVAQVFVRKARILFEM